ncbi:DUF349 domain-containing protein [Glaciimonas sp. Gout2]|uniref:DUF349 domain-containing protein n=2 Tax=unclassified Glaciimonas TaxID=2644401 RepID=UPI002B22F465|nr:MULTISPECIES: DUF349 domain-containing protein [unclassified Glaciimonas]MEB0013157.1 DUF349 domain-containing protein [Glaciimonas sp. Cout2]MEB0081960.1 DUF349 domain-containing protein [Glaciimonas sp. Gout2]
MFGFLFKRAGRSAAAAQSMVVQKALQQTELRVASAQAIDSARQQALKQAASLTEESSAVVFILKAEFADARLQAAQWVHSANGLEQVLKAMRNVDRRVVKLMLSRLDVLRRQQQTSAQAVLCLQTAQELLNQEQLLPNQVAELDRAWQQIENPLEMQQQEFRQISAALASRLSAQAELQRAVLGLLARLRQLNQQINDDPLAHTADEVAFQAAQIAEHMQQHQTNVEAITLPKQLASEYAVAFQVLQQRLQTLLKSQETLNARLALLTQWESMAAETLKPELLRRSWTSLGVLSASQASDQIAEQRYEALLKLSIASAQPVVLPKSAQPLVGVEQPTDTDKVASHQQFVAALEGLEAALEEGALQVAMDYDKTLRAMDFKALKITPPQNARLVQARGELGRLQGWARWGGNVSREELMKAAQELSDQGLAVIELAKKIGSLRARWKSLDSSAGSAPKVLWDGFDAACTAAYLPVAAHFQLLAEERQRNQIKALLLIDEIQQYAAVALNNTDSDRSTGSVAGLPDWKAIAQFCQQKQQAWRGLGAINRSEKKSLDKSFANASQQLLAPLLVQQQREITNREKLITEASELPVNQRDTAERLRELQLRWQEQAKALPLSRQDEQLLWQRFRIACDTIFTQRKEAASTADTERRQNLQVKEELCTSLEAAISQIEVAVPSVLTGMLRQTQQDWSRTGAVPRGAEAQIEARLSAAVASLQAHIDQARHNAVIAEAHALCDKLALCQLVEVSLGLDGDAEPEGNPDRWDANWQAMPTLPSVFEKTMRSRFDTALQLHRVAERPAIDAYLMTLENNREKLLQELLRAEIITGVDSPATLTRERLQVQVEVLQAALKAGTSGLSSSDQLLRACGLPALMDYVTRERAEHLIMSVKGRAEVAKA